MDKHDSIQHQTQCVSFAPQTPDLQPLCLTHSTVHQKTEHLALDFNGSNTQTVMLSPGSNDWVLADTNSMPAACSGDCDWDDWDAESL